MVYRLLPDYYGFPDPEEAEPSGLIAIEGDLSPQRLVEAYANGIFPWPSGEGDPLLWFSLDPRMVLNPNEFKYSKSLRRTVASGKFEVRVDTCFEQVIRGCAETERDDQDGTWITKDIIAAYVRLHEMGLAHSFETFYEGQLVGGLYGVSLGNMFSGESMFHTMRDASKVAFARLVEFCTLHGFCMIDAQQPTRHLASLGAKPIPRADFLKRLSGIDYAETLQGYWRNSVVLLLGSNQGDRHVLIDEAIKLINGTVGWVSTASPRYETEPWGMDCEDRFLNQAVVVETEFPPLEVLHRVLAIEAVLGRKRSSVHDAKQHDEERTYESRPIDIDLMFYNSEIVADEELQLPHPRLHLRRFSLQPLCDICPDFQHPVLKKSIRQLLEECPDGGEVRECS